MEFLFLLWFLLPIAGWVIADKKGRNTYLWAFLSYFTVWGLLVLLVLPSNKKGILEKDNTKSSNRYKSGIFFWQKED